MGGTFHLRLFGIPELQDPGGRTVAFRTRKQLALLIYLAFEARVRHVSREKLVELFWPGGSPPKSRHSLSQALTAIRAAFGQDVTRRAGESIQFVGEINTDLDLPDWNAVDAAHPLSQLDTCASADFAHWVEGVRQRCTRAARGKLIEAIERARISGDARAVHERATTLYAVDPVSDFAAQALAETLLLEGNPPAAMRFLRNHLARADEELGKIEHTEIRRLLRNVEKGDVAPRIVSKPAESFGRSARAEVFVGRESEMGQLEATWCVVRPGTFQTVLLAGPAGIGKSSLLRRFATSLTARAFPTVIVTCQEIGAGIPFAVVADLMRELARDPSIGGTDPMWLSEATRVYPALKATYPGISDPPPAPAEAIRLRIAEALLHMVEAVADTGPIFVGLDDLQHLDPASRDVLHLLARRWESSPVMLAGTLRTLGPQAQPDASAILVERGTVLEVGPLGKDQIVSIIAQSENERPVEEKIRDEIALLAQGNPYFAEMLLTDWQQHTSASLAATAVTGKNAAWQPPRTMRLAFARLFDGMSPETRDLLDLLAVTGRALSESELVNLLKWDGSIDEAVSALMRRGIIRFEQGTFAFKNELHRAFVYYAMEDEARRYDHARIARHMKGWAPEHDFQTAFEMAHHLVKAGIHDEALSAVERGAEVAISRGAPREAEKALVAVMDAVRRPETDRLGLLLARAVEAQGRYRDALEAINKWSGATTANEAATAAILRAQALRLGRLGSDSEIVAAARTAMAQARLSKNARAIAQALQVQAEVASEVGDPKTLRWASRASKRLGSESLDPQVRALSSLTRGYSLLVTGDLEAARQSFRDSDRLFSSTLLDTERQRTLNGIGMCSTGLADLESAVEAFQTAIRIADRAGDVRFRVVLRCNLSSAFENFGYFTDAMEHVAYALKLCELSSPRARAVSYGRAASLAIVLGNRDQARRFVDAAERAADVVGIPMYSAAVMLVKSEYLISTDEHELAWPLIEAAFEIAQRRDGAWSELAALERLRRQWIYATQGYAALLLCREEDRVRCRSIVDSLEIRALEAWAAQQNGVRTNDMNSEHVLQEIESRSLFGVVAKLDALGICPGEWPRKTGESSAQRVARLFPDPSRGCVPPEVPISP